jgi:tRNA(adenine34) deaminase
MPPPRSRNVSDVDLAMMRRALVLADEAAAMGEVPVGAVVYRGEEIIAEAFNLREAENDPTAHAELIAMRKAGEVLGEWRLTGCSLAVTLEPCPMCAGALVNARVERVIYGAADPKAGACHTLYKIPSDTRLNHRVEIIRGVLEPECRRQLQAFFRERRVKKA